MNFSSLTFLYFFFPITILLFLIINRFLPKMVNLYLLIISIIFYLWNNLNVGIIFFLICSLIYIVGHLIFKYKSKTLLIISVLALIILLIYFKYVDFSIGIINKVLHQEIDLLYLTIPLGMSFAIFESISYLIDVYKGNDKGTYIDVMLFLMFFPKISEGPIVTWNVFNDQLKKRNASFDKVTYGIERIIIGLAKKVIIADILGKAVNIVVSSYTNVDSVTLALTMLCYMIELYFDFSGYSDMAIGISKIFGFDFAENFNYPYLSLSITEFWQRWHISLGNFFKKYLYIPLGGNRKHVYLNLFIVFLVSGIWHGNGLGYLTWGGLIGICVCIERYIKNKNWYKKVPRCIKWFITMIIIYFSWIVFMMPSLSASINYVKIMFSFKRSIDVPFTYKYYFDKQITFTLIIGIIGSILDIDKLKTFINENKIMTIIKYLFLFVLFLMSIIYVVNSTYSPFLYFRF